MLCLKPAQFFISLVIFFNSTLVLTIFYIILLPTVYILGYNWDVNAAGIYLYIMIVL
jgi:hypothetical protein